MLPFSYKHPSKVLYKRSYTQANLKFFLAIRDAERTLLDHEGHDLV